MTRIWYLLREIGRNIFRNPGTTFSSVLSLALLLLLFDLYWIGAKTSTRFYTDLLSDFKMEAFVDESVPDSTVSSIHNRIAILDGVLVVDFISKSRAREELHRLVGQDLLIGYDTLNPLPRSFIISFRSDYLSAAHLEQVADQLETESGISEVYYSKRWLDKAEAARTLVRNVGLALGILILLAAMISSTNDIRLMTRTRSVGFRQMQLVGAGRLFLALPFLVEGFFIGSAASAVGWSIIFYARQRISFSMFEIIYPSNDEILIFCLAISLLGVVSGYFGVRKNLKHA